MLIIARYQPTARDLYGRPQGPVSDQQEDGARKRDAHGGDGNPGRKAGMRPRKKHDEREGRKRGQRAEGRGQEVRVLGPRQVHGHPLRSLACSILMLWMRRKTAMMMLRAMAVSAAANPIMKRV